MSTTIWEQLKSSLCYMKSPIFVCYVALFSLGSNSIGLALNMTNDILRKSDLVKTDKITFDKLQTTFEVARVAVNIIVCWMCGAISDVLYARLWKGKNNSDLKQVFLLYSIALLSMLLFSLALTTDNVIFYITTMPMMTGMVFMYFLTGVAINFPVESHGILYGIIELIGSIIAFSSGNHF